MSETERNEKLLGNEMNTDKFDIKFWLMLRVSAEAKSKAESKAKSDPVRFRG